MVAWQVREPFSHLTALQQGVRFLIQQRNKKKAHIPLFFSFFPVAVLNKEVYAFLHPHLRKDLKPQRDLGENTASC